MAIFQRIFCFYSRHNRMYSGHDIAIKPLKLISLLVFLMQARRFYIALFCPLHLHGQFENNQKKRKAINTILTDLEKLMVKSYGIYVCIYTVISVRVFWSTLCSTCKLRPYHGSRSGWFFTINFLDLTESCWKIHRERERAVRRFIDWLVG